MASLIGVQMACRFLRGQHSQLPSAPAFLRRSIRTPHDPKLQPYPPIKRYFQSTPASRINRIEYSYKRFQNTQSLFRRWAQRPTFYLEVGGIGLGIGGIYVYNLETVPVSGRRRFNIYGPWLEESLANSDTSAVLKAYGGKVMSDWDPRTQQVKRVLNRLIPACGLENLDWQVFVIDNDSVVNAMVVPGGKVFVFSGILKYTKDDDGLAAVLGHEISHVVARHVAERMSRNIILVATAFIADMLYGTGAAGLFVINMLLEMPNSRVQEREADYMGLMLMAQSCFDPMGAVRFWERMAKSQNHAPPEILSTHPDSANRVELIKGWLQEAEEKRASSNCASVLGYAEEFRQAFPQVRW